MNPDSWGVSICSIDGQRCGFGDAGQMFTMQALSNPIIYASVLSELGKYRNFTDEKQMKALRIKTVNLINTDSY